MVAFVPSQMWLNVGHPSRVSVNFSEFFYGTLNYFRFYCDCSVCFYKVELKTVAVVVKLIVSKPKREKPLVLKPKLQTPVSILLSHRPPFVGAQL